MLGAGYSQTSASGECQYCPYASGNDYLRGVNLDGHEKGGRDIGISLIYVVVFFGLVWLFVSFRLLFRPVSRASANFFFRNLRSIRCGSDRAQRRSRRPSSPIIDFRSALHRSPLVFIITTDRSHDPIICLFQLSHLHPDHSDSVPSLPFL